MSEKSNISSSKPTPSLWRRIARIVMITAGCLLLLIVLALGAVVWLLRPERLTPIVERLATNNLDAEVTLSRAELTLWKSFPNLKVEVTDLKIVSHSLNGLADSVRRTLPADADSLLSVGYFTGSINILSAVTGKIALKDVLIDRPHINLLQVNDSVSNFNIVPPSAETDTTKSSLPDISISHFAITNAHPVTYRSLADSLEVEVELQTIDLQGDNSAPTYMLTVATRVDSPLLEPVAWHRLPLSLDGGLEWRPKDNNTVGLRDLHVGIDKIDICLNALLELGGQLEIKEAAVEVTNLDVAEITRHIPEPYAQFTETLSTDMIASLGASLTEPYVPGDSISLPRFEAHVNIPDCRVRYQNVDWEHFRLRAKANVDGNDLNASTVELDRLYIDGRAIDIDVKAKAADLLSDPHITGRFTGSLDMDALPKRLMSMLDADLSGKLAANVDFNLRADDFSRERFHKIMLTGNLTLDDFAFATPDSVTSAYTRHSRLEFGTSGSFDQNAHHVDSVLYVRLDIDSISFATLGVEARMADLSTALGTSNRYNSFDTTMINPFGGSLKIGRLYYDSLEDSVCMRLRDASGRASMLRYRGSERVPQLSVRLDIANARVANPEISVSMRKSALNVTANMRPRRGERRADGSRTDGPRCDRIGRGEARGDGRIRGRSNSTLTFAQYDSIGNDVVNFNVDNSVRNVLMRWDVKGSLKADRGRLRMGGMRIRNSFRDLSVSFTTDSISLDNLCYRFGHSDFSLCGFIGNIKRATSPRRPAPLKMELNIASDTINVNEIVRAFTHRDKHRDDSFLADEWAESEVDQIVDDEPADSVIGPVLVPINLDAGLHVSAKNVIYADMFLHDIDCQALIYGGALNLHNFHASTEAGSLDVSALYNAPTPDNMSFGISMGLDNFYINRLHDVVPAIDTIMPIIKSFSGIINAQIAATADLTPDMYVDMPTLKAAMQFEGDSLVVIDSKTFRKIGRWLLFKHKDHNMIDHLRTEIVVDSGQLILYPFILDIDRYKLGIMGHNDMNLNLNYHIAVLKSPIPFRFGINIKGNPDHIKIRLGGAKFKENMVAERAWIATDTRINLLDEINKAFRRGVRAARLGPIDVRAGRDTTFMSQPDTDLAPSDSALFIREGVIEVPDSIRAIYLANDSIPIIHNIQ